MTSPIITKLTELFANERTNPQYFQFTDAVEQTEGYFEEEDAVDVWSMFTNPDMWSVLDGEDDQPVVSVQELIDYAEQDGYVDPSWKSADPKNLQIVTILHYDEFISDHVYACALTDLACSKMYAAYVNVD